MVISTFNHILIDFIPYRKVCNIAVIAYAVLYHRCTGIVLKQIVCTIRISPTFLNKSQQNQNNADKITSSPVLAILKLQHEKVRIGGKNRLMSKISSYDTLTTLGTSVRESLQPVKCIQGPIVYVSNYS